MITIETTFSDDGALVSQKAERKPPPPSWLWSDLIGVVVALIALHLIFI